MRINNTLQVGANEGNAADDAWMVDQGVYGLHGPEYTKFKTGGGNPLIIGLHSKKPKARERWEGLLWIAEVIDFIQGS